MVVECKWSNLSYYIYFKRLAWLLAQVTMMEERGISSSVTRHRRPLVVGGGVNGGRGGGCGTLAWFAEPALLVPALHERPCFSCSHSFYFAYVYLQTAVNLVAT